MTSRFIEELRKCDPAKFIQAPTEDEEKNRRWVGTPIGMFLAEWDELVRDRDRHKEQAQYWLRAATGITPQHYEAPK